MSQRERVCVKERERERLRSSKKDGPGNPFRKGWLSTVDLLVLADLDQSAFLN